MKLLLRLSLIFFYMTTVHANELVIIEPKITHAIPNYSVQPRNQDIKSFPCSQCHPTFKSKVLMGDLQFPHADLTFKHMPEVRNCVFCHSRTKVNGLHLLDGAPVSYNESYKICSQCHGKIATNWKKGLHGRIMGHWNGDRLHFNCTICHNAHDPKFKSMEAMAPPALPKFLIEKEEHR